MIVRALVVAAALLLSVSVLAQPLTTEQKSAIDVEVARILKESDVPSASIAIVTDGKLDYARAYGDQRLDGTPATTTARYPVASISKQFTAAAILLLVEDGKLTLDDKVAKYLPTLTGAETMTIRQLLSHTSGIRDYWPQDYPFEAMRKPITPKGILDQWAKAPLDFPPGSKRQYSNTGYTAAGLIVETVAKEPLHSFEQRRIFRPLGMDVVLAATNLSAGDAHGTTRYALGPVRPAPGELAGWSFAAGDLAMSPSELAKWNIARLTRAGLKSESWQLQETDVAPAAGGSKYGLGVGIDTVGQHPRIKHNGGWTGYLSTNRVYPSDHAAISVFINGGFSNSPDAIGDAIEAILFKSTGEFADVRATFEMLRSGQIDRSKFTENGNFFFSSTVLSDSQTSLAPLGTLKTIARFGPTGLRGGLTADSYILNFDHRKLLCIVRTVPETRRIEEFSLYPYTE